MLFRSCHSCGGHRTRAIRESPLRMRRLFVFLVGAHDDGRKSKQTSLQDFLSHDAPARYALPPTNAPRRICTDSRNSPFSIRREATHQRRPQGRHFTRPSGRISRRRQPTFHRDSVRARSAKRALIRMDLFQISSQLTAIMALPSKMHTMVTT